MNLIKPKQKLFIAIDGVGTRAKMNKRYKPFSQSAKHDIGWKNFFDASFLQPGCEFMVKLDCKLQSFLSLKQATNLMWKHLDIILSSHLVPGEAEHKIFEFIRYQKSQPGYIQFTRHCLYGLDADLIMLGLCSHEPYLSVLREEVTFFFFL